MQVKVCGITNEADARAAATAGVHAVGLNFASGPREIDASTAESIVSVLPPFVTPVVLAAVDDRGGIPAEFRDMLQRLRIFDIQLYGTAGDGEISGLCRDGFRVICVDRPQPGDDAQAIAGRVARFREAGASAVLLDSFHTQQLGGTGEAADWKLLRRAIEAVPDDSRCPIVLAGGLTPENVAEAIAVVQPDAVDVSSGVERSVGAKDIERMRAFVVAACCPS